MATETLIIAVLSIHLIAMNLASAGPLSWLWIPQSEDPLESLRLRIARWSLASFLLGMVTGGLLWLVIPGDGLSQAFSRFPTRAIWFAGVELGFSLLCLLPLAMKWRFRQGRPWLSGLLAIMSATNLLYHFPPIMAIIGQLAANPNWTSHLVMDRPAVLKLTVQDHILALWVHFGLASVAVAAIATLILVASFDVVQVAAQWKRTLRCSSLLGFLATLLQVPVGIWLLASMPMATRTALMGGSLSGSLAFVAALAATLLLLQRLLSILLGDFERKTLLASGWLLLVVIVLMTGAMRLSRPTVRSNAGKGIPSAVELPTIVHSVMSGLRAERSSDSIRKITQQGFSVPVCSLQGDRPEACQP